MPNASNIATPLPNPFDALPVGSENSPPPTGSIRGQAVVQHVFIGGADIPDADLPRVGCRLVQVERHEHLVLPSAADPMLVEKLVADRPLVLGTIDVVRTASFSGNAFSVTNGLGRFRSPRGHPRSAQNVRT